MGSLFALIVVVAGNVSLGQLQIRSDVACPTADSVGASLQPLIGAGQAAAATLSVARGPSSFEVRLVDVGGALVAQRSWPFDVPCAATTEAIAVVAATWLGELPPVSREIAPPSAKPPPLSTGLVLETVAAPPPTRSSRQWAVVVGAGVASPIAAPDSGVVSWPVAALKVAGEVGGTGEVAPFGGLGFVIDLPRDHELDAPTSSNDGTAHDGAYSWYRWAVEPMGGVTVRTGRIAFTTSAGLSLGRITAHGTNAVYTPNYQYFDGGVIAEVRARVALDVAAQRIGLWAAFRGRAAIDDKGLASLGPLGPGSRFEAGLIVGGDYSWPR